jgi:hypothetical protein
MNAMIRRKRKVGSLLNRRLKAQGALLRTSSSVSSLSSVRGRGQGAGVFFAGRTTPSPYPRPLKEARSEEATEVFNRAGTRFKAQGEQEQGDDFLFSLSLEPCALSLS